MASVRSDSKAATLSSKACFIMPKLVLSLFQEST